MYKHPVNVYSIISSTDARCHLILFLFFWKVNEKKNTCKNTGSFEEKIHARIISKHSDVPSFSNVQYDKHCIKEY